jgi:hypothetical protein
LLLVLLMIAALPAAAKGRFTRVIITGEALEQSITVTDPLTLNFLSLGILEDLRPAGSVEAPVDAAEVGYELERQWEDGNGETQTFDHVRYHPNTDTAELGYVYVADTLVGTPNFEGKWYPTTPEGDAAIRAVLAGEPVTCPVTPTDDSSGQPLYDGDVIRLLPLKFDGFGAEAAATSGDPTANVAGTVLLDEAVRGSFWMDIIWLQGGSETPIRFDGETDWQDNLELDRIDANEGDETIYEWEALLAEPGCYWVYTWAGDEALTVYVEYGEND